jgi:hypothetical protein
MRVVIDASIDPRLVEAFPDHHVQTLFDLGWQHLKDHVLVITADRGFEHDLKSLSFGIVIIHVPRNKIIFYRPLFPQLLIAVATIKAGDVFQPSRPAMPAIYQDQALLPRTRPQPGIDGDVADLKEDRGGAEGGV